MTQSWANQRSSIYRDTDPAVCIPSRWFRSFTTPSALCPRGVRLQRGRHCSPRTAWANNVMSDNRVVLKTIIQSATVELFQVYAVAVAPVSGTSAPFNFEQYVGGFGSFYGTGLNATLSLLVPKDAFTLIKVEGLRLYNVLDWTRELTNQLLGRIKNRLAQYQLHLRTDIPSATEGKALEIRQTKAAPFVSVTFRTIRGDILVALAGTVDYTKLSYSGAVTTANEGDVILF